MQPKGQGLHWKEHEPNIQLQCNLWGHPCWCYKDGGEESGGIGERVENGADEGGRKDSEADVERKRIKDKLETFMKNHFFKVTSKNPSDLTKDSSDEGMSTSGGRLYTAALLSLKMMEKKWQ